MPQHGTDSQIELTTIEPLRQLDYAYCQSSALERKPSEVVWRDVQAEKPVEAVL